MVDVPGNCSRIFRFRRFTSRLDPGNQFPNVSDVKQIKAFRFFLIKLKRLIKSGILGKWHQDGGVQAVSPSCQMGEDVVDERLFVFEVHNDVFRQLHLVPTMSTESSL